jgi:hypothetical protein
VSTAKINKADIQAEALGVVASWLRSESHYDGEDRRDITDSQQENIIVWSQEIQEKIAILVELEIAKLRTRQAIRRMRS